MKPCVLVVLDAPRISLSAKPDDETIRMRFAAGSPLDASGAGPKWNVLIPMGTYHGPTLAPVGGKFTFDAAFFNELIANWKANGSFRIPVRWGHEHDRNNDPAKAKDLDRKAANGTDLRVTAKGLEVLTDWNTTGRRDVTAGEFDSWSAEFRMRHLNRLTGEVGGPLLTGVGLTNDPFFNLMPPVAASAGAESTDPTPNQEQQMTPEQLKKWALSLGLSADATAEQCISASNERVTAAEARISAAATVPSEVINAAVKPVQDQVIALSAALEVEKNKGLERDVDAAIEAGKRGDGKMGRAITAELRGFILATAKGAGGLAEAQKLIAAIPASIPMKAIGIESAAEGGISASAANEKLNSIANELQAKGDKAPMESAMRSYPELAKAARSLSTATRKQS